MQIKHGNGPDACASRVPPTVLGAESKPLVRCGASACRRVPSGPGLAVSNDAGTRCAPKLRVALALLMLYGLSMSIPAQAAQTPVAMPLARPATELTGERAQHVALQALSAKGQLVLAVGERGIALRSDDAGNTWVQASTPVSVTLTDVALVSPEQAWAVGHGGVVLSTEDGGRTWRRRYDGTEYAQLARAAAQQIDDPEERARQLGEAQRLIHDGPDKPFFAVHAVDAKTILATGAFNIAALTRDGGQHWMSISTRLPNPMGAHLYGIAGDGAQIFIVGEFGLVLRSNDRGEDFEKLEFPYEGSLFAIAVNGSRLLVGGLRGNAFVSDDGGDSWQPVGGLGMASITAVRAAADGGFLISDQAGAVWRLEAGRSQAHAAMAQPLPPLTDLLLTPGNGVLVTSVAGIFHAANADGAAK